MRSGFMAILIVTAFLLPSIEAGAVGLDKKVDQYFNRCAPNLSDIDLSICLGKQYDLADAERKKVREQVWKMISEKQQMPMKEHERWKKSFIEAQRHWEKYREAECLVSLPYKFWGRSLAPVASMSCFLRQTILRTRGLENYQSTQ